MEFENEFTVDAPIGEVYDTLMDVERVAPCMPGAEVLERKADDAYRVGIKVKLGPVSMTYRGDVEIVERDQDAHTAKMSVKAKEARGQGTANATVDLRLAEQHGNTHGTIDADVRLSGRAAAMGRGIVADVSERLVDEFARNLAAMLAGPEPEPAAQPAPPPEPTEPTPEPAPSTAELDAADLAAGVLAQRMREPRFAMGALGAAALLGYLVGRRRR